MGILYTAILAAQLKLPGELVDLLFDSSDF
jgi:hypothetical protein